MKAVLALALLLTTSSFAQTAPPPTTATTAPAKPIAFDVVSIKPNRSGSPSMVGNSSRDSYSVQNYPLRMVLSDAFGIRYDLISGGPAWLDGDHYDLIAKVTGDDLEAYRALTKEQRSQMIQAVLADRFHLVAHTESKELPGYTLTIAKNGPKLDPAKPGQRSGYGANMGDYKCTAVPIATLAKLLSGHLQQTVLDQTSLTDKYTFELKWEFEGPGARTAASGEASTPSGLPDLPTALQEQLGLKLTPAKLPTTTLVIDSISRPSEN